MKFSDFQSILGLLLLLCSHVLAAGIELEQMVWEVPNRGELYGYIGTITLLEEITMTQLTTDTQETMEMLKARLRKDQWPPNTWPAALSGFTVDRKKIYFATSIRGPGAVPGKAGKAMGIQKQVIKALDVCKARVGSGWGHNNDGKCGEIMATNAWFKENGPNSSLINQDKKLIVTVNQNREPIRPCQNSHKDEKGAVYGCRDYLRELGFKPDQVNGCGKVQAQTCPPPNSPTAPNTPTSPNPHTTSKPGETPTPPRPKTPPTNTGGKEPEPQPKTPPTNKDGKKPEPQPKTPPTNKDDKKPEPQPKTPPTNKDGKKPERKPPMPPTNTGQVKKSAFKKASKRAPVRRHARMFG
ncbi:hypothetical protein BDZ91DRAFT_766748 [Kalaharituber pfeilii]|nr:hypothetical protein BDZ91DRAFT_766748 [Kalaharituber pfeilii]